MVADNYIRIYVGAEEYETYFYETDDATSFDIASRAMSRALTALERQGKEPRVAIYKHERRLAFIECIGTCERCAPAPMRVASG